MTTRCPPPVLRNAARAARHTAMVPRTLVATTSDMTSCGHLLEQCRRRRRRPSARPPAHAVLVGGLRDDPVHRAVVAHVELHDGCRAPRSRHSAASPPATSGARPVRTTWTPSWASRRAVARPMPLDAPVTSAPLGRSVAARIRCPSASWCEIGRPPTSSPTARTGGRQTAAPRHRRSSCRRTAGAHAARRPGGTGTAGWWWAAERRPRSDTTGVVPGPSVLELVAVSLTPCAAEVPSSRTWSTPWRAVSLTDWAACCAGSLRCSAVSCATDFASSTRGCACSLAGGGQLALLLAGGEQRADQPARGEGDRTGGQRVATGLAARHVRHVLDGLGRPVGLVGTGAGRVVCGAHDGLLQSAGAGRRPLGGALGHAARADALGEDVDVLAEAARGCGRSPHGWHQGRCSSSSSCLVSFQCFGDVLGRVDRARGHRRRLLEAGATHGRHDARGDGPQQARRRARTSPGCRRGPPAPTRGRARGRSGPGGRPRRRRRTCRRPPWRGPRSPAARPWPARPPGAGAWRGRS